MRALLRKLADRLQPARVEVARLEQKAEQAYSAMYDALPHNVRDCHDDAQMYLSQAAKLAKRSRMARTARRLEQRGEHIRNVYDHQFRWSGR